VFVVQLGQGKRGRHWQPVDAGNYLGRGRGHELGAAASWSEQQLEETIRRFAEAEGLKLGQVAQPLRVALSGSTVSPGIFEILAILGPAEAKARLLAAAG